MTDEESRPPRVNEEGVRLAEKIKHEREYLGLKQEQVAEVLSISRAAVSAIETGRRRVSSQEVRKLASLFGTSVDRLMGADAPADPTTDALFRTTRDLSSTDREQVLRFAEFLRTAGQPPSVGDGS